MQAQPEIAMDALTARTAPTLDPLAELTAINLDDLTAAAGWQGRPRLAAALRWLFHAPAEQFARQMLDFDRAVGEHDLPAAARRSLAYYVHDVRVFGRENLPPSGPVIVLANHPGMSDTLSLFAAVSRPDLRIIAIDRPFLRALPNVSAQLFYVSEDAAHRIAAVKRTSAHLRGGGSVLTFPAGEIEPDPAVYPGAIEWLSRWTDSAGVFLRFAPQAVIVPAVLRNVVWDRIAHAKLLRLNRNPADRERLVAALQLLSHLVLKTRPVTITVQFGVPVSLAEVGSTALDAIHTHVVDHMRELLMTPPQGEGESVM
jgi:acyltransferase-like protein